MSDYPKLKDHPRLKTLLALVSPNYRKHTVFLCESSVVHCHPSYWDGGSRTYYAKATPKGRNVQTVNTATAPAHFGGSDDPVEVDLDANTVVVTGGTFCGKPAHATVYATKDVIAWLQGE